MPSKQIGGMASPCRCALARAVDDAQTGGLKGRSYCGPKRFVSPQKSRQQWSKPMVEQHIQFNDGDAYDRSMGVWSQLVGEVFLDWLAPAPGLRWINIGCGTGAFTELIVSHCAPAEVHGIDPSKDQLAFARGRLAAAAAEFHQGDATALPLPNGSIDIAAMALVIFFVPKPSEGVAEMIRVTRPGGMVAAYAWDMLEGGFAFEPIHAAKMRAAGVPPPLPPSVEVSRMGPLRELWKGAGLGDVQTRVIRVERTFADFGVLGHHGERGQCPLDHRVDDHC